MQMRDHDEFPPVTVACTGTFFLGLIPMKIFLRVVKITEFGQCMFPSLSAWATKLSSKVCEQDLAIADIRYDTPIRSLTSLKWVDLY